MNLWELSAGQNALLAKFQMSMPSTYSERLQELGFTVGQNIKCIQHPPLGAPRVYRVGDSVFSLAKDIALLIEVSA